VQSRCDTEIHKELAPGEHLLWSGRPRRVFDVGKLIEVFIALGMTGSGVYRIVQNNWHLTLFNLLWTGGCSIWLVKSLVIGPWDRATQIYGLTDRRVLIIHRGFGRKVEAMPLHTMQDTNLRLAERPNRNGTIGFADFAQACGYDNNELCMPEFFEVAEALQVAEQIGAAIRSARSASKPWPRPLFADAAGREQQQVGSGETRPTRRIV
jgi:hypothetical protein